MQIHLGVLDFMRSWAGKYRKPPGWYQCYREPGRWWWLRKPGRD